MEIIEGIEVIVGTYEELTLGYRLGKDSEQNDVVYPCISYIIIVYFNKLALTWVIHVVLAIFVAVDRLSTIKTVENW